jgi:hypothetical protein
VVADRTYVEVATLSGNREERIGEGGERRRGGEEVIIIIISIIIIIIIIIS